MVSFFFSFSLPFRSTSLGGLHDFREKIIHKHCKIIRGRGKWGCVGGILGGGYNMKTKICKQNSIGTYLSEDFRKHTQAKEVESNLTNPLHTKARIT